MARNEDDQDPTMDFCDRMLNKLNTNEMSILLCEESTLTLNKQQLYFVEQFIYPQPVQKLFLNNCQEIIIIIRLLFVSSFVILKP